MVSRSDDEIWANVQRKVAALEVKAAETGLYHRGYRFWPPYACGRCGEPITAHQFAFSRSCGGCDCGNSRTARLSIFDQRWFLLGKATLENDQDEGLITPEFIPAYSRKSFPVLYRDPMPRPLKPKPIHRRYPLSRMRYT